MRRRCSRPGRREFPTRRRRLRRAATIGQWHVLRREFGYPAGMPRRMSVPLGRLPRATRELRLRTTQEIYWDRLAVAYARRPGRGRSRAAARVGPAGVPPGSPVASCTQVAVRHTTTIERVPLADTRHARGFYTAPGLVTELVAAEDGAVAVFGPGEEVQFTFSASLPPLRSGWTRRFVLEARGWCKDMDLYTKDGETVGPLPGARGPVAAAASAPLHNAVRVGTMTAGRWREFAAAIQDPAKVSDPRSCKSVAPAIVIVMKPIALVCIPV